MKSVIVSFSLDPALLEKIDRLVSKMGYSTRSEVIRDAARRLIAEYELPDLKSSKVMAAIVVVYEYSEEHIERRLARIRHEYNDVVVGNLHIHVEDTHCTELLIARGRGERVLSLIATIRGLRGIVSARHLIVPLHNRG